MKYIKKYNKYLESIKIDVSIINVDINESLGIYYENILKSIGAEELNIFDTFSLPKDDFSDKLNLDLLTTSPEFINVQNSDDYETYLNKPCRFMMIYNIESNELENPSYILFQSYNETLSKWEDVKLFKVTGDIKAFYDKLSSKVIEIDDNGEKYIYHSSNKNEWTLQNKEESDTYKKYFRNEDFEKLINDKKVTINII